MQIFHRKQQPLSLVDRYFRGSLEWSAPFQSLSHPSFPHLSCVCMHVLMCIANIASKHVCVLQTNEIKQELYEAPATAKAGLTAAGTKVNDTLSNATTNVKQAVSGDGYTRPPHSDVFSNRTVTTNDSYSTKNGTTAAAYSTKNGTADDKSSIVSPTDTDGDSETDDEAGSEYTVGSSAPTTPRGSVLAPSPDAANGKDKKKRRKRISKGIKKTFSKISDALTPSSSQG